MFRSSHRWVPVVLVAALPLAATAQDRQRSVVQLVRESADWAVSNRVTQAADLAREAVRLDPAYAEAWRQLAHVETLMNNPTGAVHAARQALLLNPRDAIAWRELGWSLWSLSRRDEALEAFGQALTNGVPDRARLIAMVLGQVVESGDGKRAVDLYRRWAPGAPYMAAALELVQAGRAKAAEPLLSAAWTAGEDPPVCGLYLGLINAWNNNFSAALDFLSPFIDSGIPSATRPRMNAFFECLGLASRSPRFEEFVDRIEKGLAAAQRPDDEARFTAVLEQAAFSRRSAGELPAALRLLRRALQRDPNRLTWIAGYNLAMTLNGPVDAHQFATGVLARASSPAVTEGVAGVIAEEGGDWSLAAKHYAASIGAAPLQLEIRDGLFRCLVRSGLLAEARAQAVWMQEEGAAADPQARVTAAEMWDRLGETALALDLWQILHLATPDTPYYGIETARCLFELGQPEDAIATLTGMLDNKPTPAVFEWLAAIESASGNPQKAAEWASRGLAVKPTRSLLREYAENAELAGLNATSRLDAASAFLLEDPGYVPMNLLKQRTLVELGRDEDAIAHAAGLLERNHAFLPALLTLREISTRTGRLDDALAHAVTMQGLRPWDTETTRRLAVSYAEDRQFRPALKILRRMARQSPVQATSVLLYGQLAGGPYPGLTTVTQAVSHIRSIAAERIPFLLPGDLATGSTNGTPGVMLVFVDSDASAIRTIDAALRDVGGRALYAATPSTLQRPSPRRPGPAEWTELCASGRWMLASAGPDDTARVLVSTNGLLGNPLTHRILTKDGLEDASAFSNRIERLMRECAEGLEPSSTRLLVLPGGDAGQMSLDCSTNDLAVLASISARHFSSLVVTDDSGFHVPGAPAPFLSAKRVPPGWTGASVIEHIRKANPLIRARLELAKILYWQGQHEEADSWFLKARESGVDAGETAFNRGSNAHQQGDLPTALRELRTASELVPSDPRAGEALRRATDRRRTEGRAFIRGWDDNEDRQYEQYGADAEGPVTDAFRLGAFADWNRWEKTGLGSEEGTRLGASGRWYPRRGTWLDARAWELDMSDVEDDWGGTANLHLPNVPLRGSLELQIGRDEIETVEALRENIFAEHAAILTASRLFDMWDLYANGIYTRRTDENETTMLDGRLVRRLNEWPFAGAGVVFRLADSDFDPDEYWAPEELQQYQLYGTLRGDHGPLTYALSGQWGYAKETGTDWREVWGGRAFADCALIWRTRLFGEVSYFEGPEYNRITWQGGINGRF